MSDLTAEQWNDQYPIGTPVTAYPGLRPEHPAFAEFGSKRLKTCTRSVAWNPGHGEPVVAVEGYAGGISLEHIDLRTEEDQPMSQPQPADLGATQPLDLDAIQARCDAATPGPWGVYDGGDHANIGANLRTLSRSTWTSECEIAEIDAETYFDSKHCPEDEGEEVDAWAAQQALNDAEFIAHARTDVEQLAARVRELEAELRRERAAHSSTIDDRDRAAHYADRLAAALAPEDVRGEHSAGNCPWLNALNYDGPEVHPAT